MATMPTEDREAFSAKVAEMIRNLHPEMSIALLSQDDLTVDGRRIDLENVRRLARLRKKQGSEAVEEFLDQLFSSDLFYLDSLDFDSIRSRLMPRIQPASVFLKLDQRQVAHVPFVNKTVVVTVIDYPTLTVSVTTGQLAGWGITNEEAHELARANLLDYAAPPIRTVEGKEGGRGAVINASDGYDSARLLLTDLHLRLAPFLGADFLVSIPARDRFVACSMRSASYIDQVRHHTGKDFEQQMYPITRELFLVTRDGVAGTLSEQELEI